MEITKIPFSRLDNYARIPIAFEVRTIFDIDLPQNGLGGIHFRERPVTPYIKDYDLLHSPLTWPLKFDLKNWGLFLAVDEGQAVGGAVVAWNTGGVGIMEGRTVLSVLWDILRCPERRGRGVGKRIVWDAAPVAQKANMMSNEKKKQKLNV